MPAAKMPNVEGSAKAARRQSILEKNKECFRATELLTERVLLFCSRLRPSSFPAVRHRKVLRAAGSDYGSSASCSHHSERWTFRPQGMSTPARRRAGPHYEASPDLRLLRVSTFQRSRAWSLDRYTPPSWGKKQRRSTPKHSRLTVTRTKQRKKNGGVLPLGRIPSSGFAAKQDAALLQNSKLKSKRWPLTRRAR